MAARILLSEVEEEKEGTVRDRDDRRDARSHHAGPQVEDQTLVELRQGFAAGRDNDDLDMGI
ncbi:hypothetical protein LTR94_035360 [Friedmanniomyces endolithicus]|nr:hypothetical protein LTR94_035360 [Friedmanniomyces endolithicus]